MILNSSLIPRFGKAPADAAGEMTPEDARLIVPPLLIPVVEASFPMSHESLLGSGGGSYIFNHRTFTQAGVGNNQAIIAENIPAGYYQLDGELLSVDSTGTDDALSHLDLILPGMLGSAHLLSFAANYLGTLGFYNAPIQFTRRFCFSTPWTLAFTTERAALGDTSMDLDLMLTRFV